MLVLLPPSQGKAAPARRGRPLDLPGLSFPELTVARSLLLDALVAVCSGHPEQARVTLGLSVGLAGEVELNRRLLTSATRTVADLYTGILYDALDLPSLPTQARRRAGRSLLVFSGLWGVLRPHDRVPAYRLSPEVRLPGIGTLNAHWRKPLAAALTSYTAGALVLDLRSTSYASMWRPAGGSADRTVTMRVLHEQRPGDPTSRAVVSHFNKATKGRLVRDLLVAGVDPRTPAALAATLADLGYTTEPGPGRPAAGRPHQLDVVVRDL